MTFKEYLGVDTAEDIISHRMHVYKMKKNAAIRAWKEAKTEDDRRYYDSYICKMDAVIEELYNLKQQISTLGR